MLNTACKPFRNKKHSAEYSLRLAIRKDGAIKSYEIADKEVG